MPSPKTVLNEKASGNESRFCFPKYNLLRQCGLNGGNKQGDPTVKTITNEKTLTVCQRRPRSAAGIHEVDEFSELRSQHPYCGIASDDVKETKWMLLVNRRDDAGNSVFGVQLSVSLTMSLRLSQTFS